MEADVPNGDLKKEKLSFDSIFSFIGGMGCYQITLIICGSILPFFSAENISMNFIAGDMEHWCQVPTSTDLPFDMAKDIGIPYENAGREVTYSQCEMFDLPYWNYTLDELLTWNRSERTNDDTPKKSCEDWTFDRSLYRETVSSKVL